MMTHQKLLVVCSCALLLAALWPVVQSKRSSGGGGGIGGLFKGRGKKDGNEGRENRPQPTKKSRFSPKQGLKLAGAAAAGVVGGVAAGFGLGSRHTPGHHGRHAGKNDYRPDSRGATGRFTLKSAASAAQGSSLLWTWSVVGCLAVVRALCRVDWFTM
ncbi:hypothetical protein NHX12_028067 [Muraenolepis orangiensis]|uniref:Shadow of prion protein n=1 Tax=Muraenolepis orangiensis TaxID=630683 RepID=A0A9Q0IPG2_9TELE|nr:hypothetical protein NHX12_028067 [Muraenolepis orangiensis]